MAGPSFRPAPPEVFGSAQDRRIAVGLAKQGQRSQSAGPTLRDLRNLLHITGGMGVGKTRLMTNLARQLTPTGFVAFDGRGDDAGGSLTHAVREQIALADEHRLVLIDPRDTDWPIGVNILADGALAGPAGIDQRITQILAVFASLEPETWGRAPTMREYARLAAQLVLETEPRPTFAHLQRVFTDDAYRAGLVARCANRELAAFWLYDAPIGSDISRNALLRRISMLVAGHSTRQLFANPSPRFSFADAIRERRIVLVSLPRTTYGDMATAMGLALVQAFASGAAAAGALDGDAPYGALFDDVELLTPPGMPVDDLRHTLLRLRSMGIAAAVAHAALRQVGDLGEVLLANAGSRIVMRASGSDAPIYARQYAASGLSAADYAGQDPALHHYAALTCHGRPTSVFSLAPLPWPEPVDGEPPGGAPPQDWRHVLPEGPAHPADGTLLRAAYGDDHERDGIVRHLVGLDDAAWADVTARWDAIRAAQRAYILAHPGCIPSRFERQRWLSRLSAATPRVLAEAAYERQADGKERGPTVE